MEALLTYWVIKEKLALQNKKERDIELKGIISQIDSLLSSKTFNSNTENKAFTNKLEWLRDRINNLKLIFRWKDLLVWNDLDNLFDIIKDSDELFDNILEQN